MKQLNTIWKNCRLFLFAGLVFISACEKDFVVPEQAKLKGLVVNSLFNDLNPVSVYVSDSYGSAGTNNVTNIYDARVELYEDGVFAELLGYVPSDSLNNSGQYLSKLTPQKGKKYSIVVSHPKLGVARATDSIPVQPLISSNELVQYPDSNNRLRDAVVKFKFKDDGNAENFYRINVYYYGKGANIHPNGDTVIYERSNWLRPEPLVPLADTCRDLGIFLLFSDKTFNGIEKEVNLALNDVPWASNFDQEWIWVELHTVSKTHYEYFKTLNQYRQTNYDSEPVHVYSNVQGGYGIFTGEQIQTMMITVK
jgi:hypothetical protein